MTLLWTFIAFLSGSLMFSQMLGHWRHKNLRTVGDGNPGAMNLWKAAGFRYGIAGVVLDFAKGYLPVAFILGHGNRTPQEVVLIAIAPIVGHAFSPFLKGRGGKAIAVTFGVWSALTSFTISFIFALTLAMLLIFIVAVNKGKSPTSEQNAAQIICGMLFVLGYLWFSASPGEWILLWICNLLILLYTHRRALLAFVRDDISARL